MTGYENDRTLYMKEMTNTVLATNYQTTVYFDR